MLVTPGLPFLWRAQPIMRKRMMVTSREHETDREAVSRVRDWPTAPKKIIIIIVIIIIITIIIITTTTIFMIIITIILFLIIG